MGMMILKLNGSPIGKPDQSQIDLRGMRERGEFAHEIDKFKGLKFGDFVVTGAHQSNDPEFYIGRVIQIRLGSGACGSSEILIRHPNEKLMRHENQCLWLLSDDDSVKVKSLFSEELLAMDSETEEYTIDNARPETGFIIAVKE